MQDRFGALVIGDELDHAKPHPLPYLTGLEHLGGTARKSLAFEDSHLGPALGQGGRPDGHRLTTGLTAERLLAEGADLAVAHFADPRLPAFCGARLDGVIG